MKKIIYLDFIEVHLLTECYQDRIGQRIAIDPDSANVGSGAVQAAADGAATAEDEAQSTFDLKLVEFDAKAKIKVIKEVRAIAGLGLKEAKEMVEGAPKVVKKDLSKEEAEELKAKLEEVGGTVEVV